MATRQVPDPVSRHAAQLHAERMARLNRNPLGYYADSEFQWGIVESVNPGPPPTVTVYLDGTQHYNDPAYQVTLPYLASYHPVVGDGVLIYRGREWSASDRVVLGKLAGTPNPYFLPLCGYANNMFMQGPNRLWGGAGAPPAEIPAQPGDYYLRTDTPTTANQRIYVYTGTAWEGIL